MIPLSDTEVMNEVDMQDPHDRRRFRETLAQVAADAKKALPAAVNGRVESACQLILSGDAVLLQNGDAHVGSRSSPEKIYIVKAGNWCGCPDAAHREELSGWCKHACARAILVSTHRRLAELEKEPATEPIETSTPVDDSRAHGSDPRYLVDLHGKKFCLYAGLLQAAHDKGLVSLKVDFITVTADLALAKAEAIFADGRTFADVADATPANCARTVAPHFPRVAATRAKARCLRDALCVTCVALEELGEEA